jgi:two-component system chemotaxis response regulator CheB
VKPDGEAAGAILTRNRQLQTRIVALVASAGGLHALSEVLAGLPIRFAAACVVLQHLSPKYVSHLTEILQLRCALTIKEAQDGDRLTAGMIYVGPPDHHMIVQPDGLLRLTQTARHHFSRPSADVLLGSLAEVYRERVTAVVLTGRGTDGAEGIQQIKASGGIIIAQDEATAAFFGMPGAAIQTGDVDYILALEAIAPKLIELTTNEEAIN